MKSMMETIQEVSTITDFEVPEVVRVYQCPKCNFNVQVLKAKVRGEERIIDRCIECENIEMANQAERAKERLLVRKMKDLFEEESLINATLKNACIESYHPKDDSQIMAKQAAMKYIKTFDVENPKNLLLSGSYGVGKSHLSVAIIKALVEKKHSCLFISVPRLFTKIKSTWDRKSKLTEEDITKALCHVDCLVLDDIGAEHIQIDDDGKGKGWGVSKIFEIIDSRAGKNTIFTTNLTGEQMEKRFGERNMSRLMHNTFTLTLQGEDYRRKKFKEDAS